MGGSHRLVGCGDELLGLEARVGCVRSAGRLLSKREAWFKSWVKARSTERREFEPRVRYLRNLRFERASGGGDLHNQKESNK